MGGAKKLLFIAMVWTALVAVTLLLLVPEARSRPVFFLLGPYWLVGSLALFLVANQAILRQCKWLTSNFPRRSLSAAVC